MAGKLTKNARVTREEAHAAIAGAAVARIIQDFWREFRDVYPHDVMTSNLCAVGPLQSMIGLAIIRGRLSAPESKEAGTNE